jgi:hypothetical protein
VSLFPFPSAFLVLLIRTAFIEEVFAVVDQPRLAPLELLAVGFVAATYGFGDSRKKRSVRQAI